MEEKQLRQFLEEVAVVIDANIATQTGQLSKRKAKKKPRITTEIIINDDGEEEEVEIEEPDYNPTLGYRIAGLKPQYRSCELGCGDIVPNQIIEKRMSLTPVKHWKTHCKTCHKTQGPDGTMMSSPQAQQAFSKWFISQQDK